MSKPRYHIETPRIVQPGSHNVFWLWALFFVLAAVLSWKMFDYGRQRAGFDADECDLNVGQMQQRIEELEQERDQLRHESARFERSSQIDRSAVDQVQEELTRLQEERSDLRQQVDFLKSLVSGDVSMLQLSELGLSKLAEGNSYALSFTVSKRAQGNKRVHGSVRINVVGQLKGEPAELAADDLGIKAQSLAMGFVNFQKFDLNLKLPVGFIPRELRVEVKPKGRKFKSFEQTAQWSAEPAQ